MDETERIYLDHNATTPLRPEALEEMCPYLRERHGNPSSPGFSGRLAKEAVVRGRREVAALLGAEPAEIVFTSGCTESIHHAILGALELAPDRARIVSTGVEHPATALLLDRLEGRAVEVVRLPVDRQGMLDPGQIEQALSPPPALLSLVWVNNETGVIAPVEEAIALAKERGLLCHLDAAQAVGKLPVDARALPFDLLSFSAHKIGGPKGIGALFVRKGVALPPLFCGHQERGRRGGTENVAAIVGFGVAARFASCDPVDRSRRVGLLRDRLEGEIVRLLPFATIHGGSAPRVANTSSIGFRGIDGEELLAGLERRGIEASLGSACSSGKGEPSRILAAMGISAEDARSTLRFSLGEETSPEQIDRAVRAIVEEARGIDGRQRGGGRNDEDHDSASRCG
ncbi:cysteine desulfurase [Methylacidimicrobium cyclopophantes]|uniref:cysteine desulfurase n=1 Tax=Methylacidimicrobium cyclopophantes TaxID=1041766 RepID=A0A5E6MAX4_9BACT|nr:cysteine desulfurase family protein [Methylacidimicrobium cyclopophantes]VVM04905.1 cysteine desulfurase [Methylacidimicrobium cyclopophantes]